MQKIWLWTRKLQWPTAVQIVHAALDIGYRHIDTARIYQNESEIATAIQQSWVSRTELHLTSKVWFDYVPNYHAHHFSSSDFSYTKLQERFEKSLITLKTDYLDTVLLHRPTWLENDLYAYEHLLKRKQAWKINQIWVSNFPLWYLEKFWKYFPNEISCNQIEFHPCLDSPALRTFAAQKHLKLEAYSPLAHGKILKHPILISIAQKHETTPAQICIARVVMQNLFPLPKASTTDKLLENRNAQKLILDQEDLEQIAKLPKHHRYCNPPFAPEWDTPLFPSKKTN